MSLKRSHSGGNSAFGGTDAGAKVGRQELFDELKKYLESGGVFTPVDVSLSIGASEPQVSRSLLGLAAEGLLEKAEPGKYKVKPAFGELTMQEFLKIFVRASKTDSTRQRDLSEIGRLKQNNDIMRGRLLQAIAERDHYLGALKKHSIDPGPVPVPAAPATVAPAETDGQRNPVAETAAGESETHPAGADSGAGG